MDESEKCQSEGEKDSSQEFVFIWCDSFESTIFVSKTLRDESQHDK